MRNTLFSFNCISVYIIVQSPALVIRNDICKHSKLRGDQNLYQTASASAHANDGIVSSSVTVRTTHIWVYFKLSQDTAELARFVEPMREFPMAAYPSKLCDNSLTADPLNVSYTIYFSANNFIVFTFCLSVNSHVPYHKYRDGWANKRCNSTALQLQWIYDSDTLTHRLSIASIL